jgi:hypothetical protein
MERIVYNKTLDVHKNGVQFTLQGFETADKLSRRLVISLMASGDAIDFPLEQIMALMYVNKSEEPYECEIKDNTIIYDVLPITEEGITELQLKIIETRPDGARSVLATPKFAIEVTKSNADDESIQQTTKFTALEDAVARAKEVYDKRFLRMELSEDCMFRAFYADGSIYETDVLKRLFNNGNVLLSQSFAKGGTGVRTGEDTDNSMYYSNVSKSASLESKAFKEEAQEVLADVQKHGLYTAFSVDFTTGEVEYVSPRYNFKVNTETGELDVIGTAYTFEDDIGEVTREWLAERGADVDELVKASASHTKDILEMKDTDATLDEKMSDLEDTIEKQKKELVEVKSAREWKTIGVLSHTHAVHGVSEMLSLKFDTEDFDIPEFYSECRYVIKAGSSFRCTCLATNYGSRSASLEIGHGEKNIFSLVVECDKGELEEKSIEIQEQEDVALSAGVVDIRMHNGAIVCSIGEISLAAHCFYSAEVECNFTMELQVR